MYAFPNSGALSYVESITWSFKNPVEAVWVEEYAAKFKHSDKMMQIIELEVL